MPTSDPCSERFTSWAGLALDAGFAGPRVTRLGLQLGWGPGKQRSPLPTLIRSDQFGTGWRPLQPPSPSSPGRAGQARSAPGTAPGALAGRALALGDPGARLLTGAQGAAPREGGAGRGPLLARETGVTGGRRSAARRARRRGSRRGRRNRQGFHKGRAAPQSSGPRPARQHSRRTPRASGPSGRPARPLPPPPAAPVRAWALGRPAAGSGAGATAQAAATGVSQGAAPPFPGTKAAARAELRAAGRDGVRRGLQGAGPRRWDTPRGRP